MHHLFLCCVRATAAYQLSLRPTNKQPKRRRVTFGVVLKVLNKHMLDRRRLKRQNQTMAHNLRRQRQALVRQRLHPFQLITLRSGLDILVGDIDHHEAGLEMRDGFSTWRGLLSRAETTDPKVKDGCEGQHGETWVSFAALHEGALAVAEEGEDVAEHRRGDGSYLG